MLVTKLSSQFHYGHLKGWKSKIYATTVLDSFQDRKGITLRWPTITKLLDCIAWNIGAIKEQRARGRHALSPRVSFSRASFTLGPNDIHGSATKATKMSLFCSSFRPLLWHRLFCSFLAHFYWRYPCLRKWVQGVFNWLYKKPMAAVFLQAYGLPTKILLLPLVTNMISATSV